MRLSVKAKQVLAVTTVVALTVIVLSGIHLGALAHVALSENRARGKLLADELYQQCQKVVVAPGEPHDLLRRDAGVRSILESSIAYSESVTYTTIVDPQGVAIVHSNPADEGTSIAPHTELSVLLERNRLTQLWSIYAGDVRTFDVVEPLLLGDRPFGAIRVGISTLLVRHELEEAIHPAFATAVTSLLIASLLSVVFANLMLKPIHVIRTGLTRLGRGEPDVRVDLPPGDEFGELGSFFNTVSAKLSADRSELANQKARLESVVEALEDAVAIWNRDGELLFANPSMEALLAPAIARGATRAGEEAPPATLPGRRITELLPVEHPFRRLLDQTMGLGRSLGPLPARVAVGADAEERLVETHFIHDRGEQVGVMLVAKNMDAITKIHSTLRYSQKLAALGRLSAGVAHEVKNPLNAIIIHLELLKQKLSGRRRGGPARARRAEAGQAPGTAAAELAVAPDPEGAAEHVDVIAAEIRRLDRVVQGFLKFTRPEELHLQPVDVVEILEDVLRVAGIEAERSGVRFTFEPPASPPLINADPELLRQAFINIVQNGCQAMPEGGTLTIAVVPDGRVGVVFSDTGVGIAPDHLGRIFDLYFTTKDTGNGIGLSMVYRIVQLHDGDIEVESTPGIGTTFRLTFPAA